MNIGNTVKYPINKHVYISIWNASHDLMKFTPYNPMCFIIQSLIKTPINESIWIIAYDGVCDYVYEI